MSRPAFKPTNEQRRTVRSLAAIGMRHDQIAVVIGVRSPKTVRKHFRRELSVGSAEAVATVSRVAFDMASSGQYPQMTDYWLRIMSGIGEPTDATDEADGISRPATGTAELIFVPRRSQAAEQRQEVALASNEV